MFLLAWHRMLDFCYYFYALNSIRVTKRMGQAAHNILLLVLYKHKYISGELVNVFKIMSTFIYSSPLGCHNQGWLSSCHTTIIMNTILQHRQVL